MNCKIKKITLNDCDTNIITKILNDEIRLSDLPQKFRVMNNTVYTTAFRINGALSKKRYDEDLILLEHDINEVTNIMRKLLNIQKDAKENLKTYEAIGVHFGKDIKEL